MSCASLSFCLPENSPFQSTFAAFTQICGERKSALHGGVDVLLCKLDSWLTDDVAIQYCIVCIPGSERMDEGMLTIAREEDDTWLSCVFSLVITQWHKPSDRVCECTVAPQTCRRIFLPIWLLSCVSPEVAGQVGRAWEYFPTISMVEK